MTVSSFLFFILTFLLFNNFNYQALKTCTFYLLKARCDVGSLYTTFLVDLRVYQLTFKFIAAINESKDLETQLLSE